MDKSAIEAVSEALDHVAIWALIPVVTAAVILLLTALIELRTSTTSGVGVLTIAWVASLVAFSVLAVMRRASPSRRWVKLTLHACGCAALTGALVQTWRFAADLRDLSLMSRQGCGLAFFGTVFWFLFASAAVCGVLAGEGSNFLRHLAVRERAA